MARVDDENLIGAIQLTRDPAYNLHTVPLKPGTTHQVRGLFHPENYGGAQDPYSFELRVGKAQIHFNSDPQAADIITTPPDRNLGFIIGAGLLNRELEIEQVEKTGVTVAPPQAKIATTLGNPYAGQLHPTIPLREGDTVIGVTPQNLSTGIPTKVSVTSGGLDTYRAADRQCLKWVSEGRNQRRVQLVNGTIIFSR